MKNPCKIKMKNPCRTCLVQACCTDVFCGKKSMYTNLILMDLDEASSIVYLETGYLKEDIPHNIMKEFNKAVAVCEENRQERNIIMNRHIDRFIQ